MRAQYLGEKTVNPAALPALLFAGVILEGGVISYDTNTLTGGVGATLLGIGGTAKYQQDTVTVYLRAVSVKTGEVLATVTTSKTVTAYAVDTNVFRYVASDSILETENGYTTNEPEQIVLQQAIDKAVYGLIMEGVDLKLWNFADPVAGAPHLARYRDERDGRMSAAAALAVEKASAAKTASQKSASEKVAAEQKVALEKVAAEKAAAEKTAAAKAAADSAKASADRMAAEKSAPVDHLAGVSNVASLSNVSSPVPISAIITTVRSSPP